MSQAPIFPTFRYHYLNPEEHPNLVADSLSENALVSATQGGTGFTTYLEGDIITADSTTTLSRIAAVDAGNVLTSAGVNTIPTWGKVELENHASGTLPVSNGGTGQTANLNDGQILIGSTGGAPAPANLTPGSGIQITDAAGSVTIENTNPTPAPTLTDGQLIIGSTGVDPVAASLTAGSGIQITNAAGSVTIENTNPTPAPAQQDAELLIGNTGSPPTAALLQSGSGISITNNPGSISIDTVQTSLPLFQVGQTNEIDITSTTDVLIDGMTLTPGAGAYLAFFSCTAKQSNNFKEIIISFYQNGVQLPATEMTVQVKNDRKMQIATIGHITGLLAGQAIEVKARVQSHTCTIYQRTLLLLGCCPTV